MDRGAGRVGSRAERLRRGRGLAAGLGLGLAAASGCAPFDVNVATEEPLQVDLNMEVHVYQHGKPDEAEAAVRKDYREAMTNRRNRMREIQELKNNRVVGENRLGLLEVRSQPAGDYGDYVKRTVEAENADRTLLIEHEAGEKGVSVEEISRMQWRHWQRKSFPGEWIESEGDQPGTFRWVQKQGASSEEGAGAEETGAAPSGEAPAAPEAPAR